MGALAPIIKHFSEIRTALYSSQIDDLHQNHYRALHCNQYEYIVMLNL